jgi:hypothetical protein
MSILPILGNMGATSPDASTLVYPLNPELASREAIPHDPKGNPGTPVLHPGMGGRGNKKRSC